MKNILIVGCGLLGSSLLRRIKKKKITNKIKTLFNVNKFEIFLSISDEKNYSIANVIIFKHEK